jgi:hypothetical protein
VVSSSDPTSYFVPANADFNSDTIVDSGDYVMWRKNSGITGGAVLAQGDANGDGMVDSTDYDVWRNQFNTPIAGGGMGTAATVAATLQLGDSPITLLATTQSAAESPNNDGASRSGPFEKDAAFGQFGGVQSGQRGLPRGTGVLQRFAAKESHGGWELLLSLLVHQKTDADGTDPTSSPHGISPTDGAGTYASESSLERVFGQIARRGPNAAL